MDLRDVYQRGLVRLDVGSSARAILERVVAGDDRGMDIEEAIKSDKFFTTQIITQASNALKKGEIKSLSHAAVLLGHEMVRDFILGHTALRLVDKTADARFESFSKSRDALKRAHAAQNLANKTGNEYPGLALAAGFVFDVFENWVNLDPTLQKHFGAFVEQMWLHSYRTASIANALAHHERFQVKFRRQVLAAGIVHEVGKLFLACCYPEKYEPLLKKMDEFAQSNFDEFVHLKFEHEQFDLSHTELGSLLFCKFSFLEELETVIDFHHDFSVLKTRDPDLYILVMILHISDRLALLSTVKPTVESLDVKKILEPFRHSFPLNPEDVVQLMLTLRAKALFG